MIGLAVLAVVAAYVAVFGFVIAKARSRTEKISAIVIALLIPFWDLPIGYLNFSRHCSEDGGIKVNKGLPATDAILVEASAGYTPEEIFRFGFKAAEYLSPTGIIRYTAGEKGVVKTAHPSPKSALKIQFNGEKQLPWNLVRSDYIVTRLDSGQVMATQTDFKWRGMWWQVSGAPIFGYGISCLGARDLPMLAVIAGTR